MESESDDDALSFNADLITEQQEMSTSDSQDLFAQETQPVSNSDATSRLLVESQSEDNDMLFEMLTQPNSEMICKAKANALSSSAAEDCSGVVDGSEEDATDDGLVNRKPAEICYRGVDSDDSVDDVFNIPASRKSLTSLSSSLSFDASADTQILNRSEEITPPVKKKRLTLLLTRDTPTRDSPFTSCNPFDGVVASIHHPTQTIVDDSINESHRADGEDFESCPSTQIVVNDSMEQEPKDDLFAAETQPCMSGASKHHDAEKEHEACDWSPEDFYVAETQSVNELVPDTPIGDDLDGTVGKSSVCKPSRQRSPSVACLPLFDELQQLDMSGRSSGMSGKARVQVTSVEFEKDLSFPRSTLEKNITSDTAVGSMHDESDQLKSKDDVASKTMDTALQLKLSDSINSSNKCKQSGSDNVITDLNQSCPDDVVCSHNLTDRKDQQESLLEATYERQEEIHIPQLNLSRWSPTQQIVENKRITKKKPQKRQKVKSSNFSAKVKPSKGEVQNIKSATDESSGKFTRNAESRLRGSSKNSKHVEILEHAELDMQRIPSQSLQKTFISSGQHLISGCLLEPQNTSCAKECNAADKTLSPSTRKNPVRQTKGKKTKEVISAKKKTPLGSVVMIAKDIRTSLSTNHGKSTNTQQYTKIETRQNKSRLHSPTSFDLSKHKKPGKQKSARISPDVQISKCDSLSELTVCKMTKQNQQKIMKSVKHSTPPENTNTPLRAAGRSMEEKTFPCSKTITSSKLCKTHSTASTSSSNSQERSEDVDLEVQTSHITGTDFFSPPIKPKHFKLEKQKQLTKWTATKFLRSYNDGDASSKDASGEAVKQIENEAPNDSNSILSSEDHSDRKTNSHKLTKKEQAKLRAEAKSSLNKDSTTSQPKSSVRLSERNKLAEIECKIESTFSRSTRQKRKMKENDESLQSISKESSLLLDSCDSKKQSSRFNLKASKTSRYHEDSFGQCSSASVSLKPNKKNQANEMLKKKGCQTNKDLSDVQPKKSKLRKAFSSSPINSISCSSVSCPVLVQNAKDPKQLANVETPTLSKAITRKSPSTTRRVTKRKQSQVELFDGETRRKPLADTSARRTRQVPSSCRASQVKVMFTGIGDTTNLEKILRQLGCQICTDLSKSTHLVANEAKRTIKFLCAVSRGLHIVTSKWVTESYKASELLDACDFSLTDRKSEKLHKFNLKSSLEKARSNRKGLLSNCRVFVTKATLPPVGEMKELVSAAGGKICNTLPNVTSNNLYIVSCVEDADEYRMLLDEGYTVVNKEFLLSGILRQSLDIDSCRLK